MRNIVADEGRVSGLLIGIAIFLPTNSFWAAGTGLALQQPLLYQITAQAHTERCFW
jgi:hypothetical protein